MHVYMHACIHHIFLHSNILVRAHTHTCTHSNTRTYLPAQRNAAQGLEEDLSNVIGNLETSAVLAALLAFEFWDENRRKDFRCKFSKVKSKTSLKNDLSD